MKRAIIETRAMSEGVREAAASERGELVASSYRQLAEIYHDVLSREGLDQVLDRLVKTVRHLIPVASILIAEARTEQRVLVPIVAEGGWPEGFLGSKLSFGEGLLPIFSGIRAHRHDVGAGSPVSR